MTETQLLLIRHGQTAWNRDQRIQGNGDSPLTELGKRQAEAMAQAVSRYPISAIYSSDAGRAQLTAAPLAARTGLTPQTDVRLRERHYGIFEGKTYEEIRRSHPDDLTAYQARDPHYAVPGGGESMAQLQTRGLAACTDIVGRHPGAQVAVIAHGGVIRAIARHMLDVPLAVPWRVTVNNGGLTIVSHDTDEESPWRLITLNQVSYLMHEALT